MGPDPTRAYFWHAVNKRPTRLWPGYYSTRSEEIFFDPKEKKLTFLGEIFQILTQTINGWPDPTQVKNIWPRPITSLLDLLVMALGQKLLTLVGLFFLVLGSDQVSHFWVWKIFQIIPFFPIGSNKNLIGVRSKNRRVNDGLAPYFLLGSGQSQFFPITRRQAWISTPTRKVRLGFKAGRIRRGW